MAGMRVASTDGAGWVVDTVELALTRRSRRGTRRPAPGSSPAPLGDGAQLRVPATATCGYCLSPNELSALGVDMSRMAVVAR
jgi:hypothetical protein